MLSQDTASTERRFIVVASPKYATPAADTAVAGFEQLPLAALSPSLAATAGVVLFNVDLSSSADCAAVRTAIRGARRPQLIFCVDRGARSHFESVQANALGARSVIPRPLQRRDIANALAEIWGTTLPPEPVPVLEATATRSVAAAAEIIGASFAALSTGAPLEVDKAVAASQELFAGVGQSGLHAWLDAVRQHHAGTFQHCLLVTGATVAYAAHLALAEEQRVSLGVAALLHDIGKAEIPNEVLDKPGKLSQAELALIRRHPRIGADYLIAQATCPPQIIDAVLHHHEYLDGSGYPDGLTGRDIGFVTRVLTVCDIYGALVEQRAYKPPATQPEALYALLGMAKSGKVDLTVVRTLAAALGAKLADETPAVDASA